MTVTFDPIVSWPIIAVAAAGIVALTIWAYAKRLRGTSGAWRWFAIGLRMIAILMCVMAALRPSVLFQTKVKQPSTVAFLSDASRSMTISEGGVASKTRWDAARATLDAGLKAARGLGPTVVTKAYRFDSAVTDDKVEDRAEPRGMETQIGAAFDEVLKRLSGQRILALVLLSDGSNNGGPPPLREAARLKGQGVPVVAVEFGDPTAGEGSKDIAVRSMSAGSVRVKNELNVSGMISARGFGGQTLEVGLYVEGQSAPVQTVKVKVPPRATEIPVTGLKWIPTKAGETKIKLRVEPQKGELLADNNEFATFVSVLGDGLNALYLNGPYGAWEHRYLVHALDASQKIQLTFRQLRQPEDPNNPSIDADFAKGAYDVYILGDLPAQFLTADQKALLAKRVQQGAGLMMLGGRGSFGEGGWAGTEIGDILPTRIAPGDGQIDPPDGLKVVTNPLGLDSYVLKLSANKAESRRIWENLPPIMGANRLGEAKPGALVWAQTPDREPLMVAQESGSGRVMAFGGETWAWARFSEESRLAHIKFWRQAILWLAHKEDESDSLVRLSIDKRRVGVGDRVQLTVVARDAKGEPVPNLSYEAKVVRDDPAARAAKPEAVEVFAQGNEARGTHFVTGAPGDYRVTVTAIDAAGKVFGSDSARFLAYQDDRELENPAADLSLLRNIADLTGGKSLPPEGLAKYLESLDKTLVSEYITQKDVRLWDNWWFMILFATVLTLEWFLRKRHGWV